jgi:hypothetical protein
MIFLDSKSRDLREGRRSLVCVEWVDESDEGSQFEACMAVANCSCVDKRWLHACRRLSG